MSKPWFVLLPLTMMAGAGSWCAAAGIVQAGWTGTAPREAALALSAALHVTWTGCTATSRAGLLATFAWALSFWLAVSGAGIPGALAEMVGLLQAFALRRPEPLAERLARWRRTRESVAIQLDMAPGILPWVRRSLRQFTVGSAPPRSVDALRVIAEMQDAELMARAAPGPRTLPQPGRKEP